MASFTKCMKCRKWDSCPHCGACHTCRPEVRVLCEAVRATKEGQALLQADHPRKRQSTPYAPGMGQNGTKPRASDGRRNWYKGVREAEQGVKASKPRESGQTNESRQAYRYLGDDRRRALYGGSHE